MAKNRRKSVTCANCQYQFDGIDNYCPNCGQENHSHHAPFRHMFIELVESLTHFDTKFYATVKALFLKPGLLTKDYIEDKRARYVPPIRLYVFVSFVFFFVFSLTSKEKNYQPVKTSVTSSADSIRKIYADINDETYDFHDSLNINSFKNGHVTEEQLDSIVAARRLDSDWLSRLFYKQALKQQLGLITSQEIVHSIIKNLGIAIFVLMPLFALLLKLLYISSKRFYIEHLIFAVHFHSFVFALLLTTTLLSPIIPDFIAVFGVILYVPCYCILSMRRVYGGKWGRTLIKCFFLGTGYLTLISIALVATAFISFISL